MIEAVIFDMDGVIIDSEPFWHEAEIHAYAKVGIEITDEMCRETTGMGAEDSIAYWYKRKPWKNTTFEEIKQDIFNGVYQLVEERGVIVPGVTKLLDLFENKGLRIAIASSSPSKLLDLVTTKFDIKQRFQVIHSAEHELYAKPNPAVYLSTAAKLGVKSLNCAAIEDSFNGLLAAKSALMKAVAVLEPYYFSNTKFDFADLKLRSLAEFTSQHLEILNKL
jgi:sugar-phosphatase